MTQRGKDIRGVVSDIAHRKRRVADVRFHGGAASGEAPRDVYLASCEAIAAALATDGYAYAKTGTEAVPPLTRLHLPDLLPVQ
jgi:hypothetical protein